MIWLAVAPCTEWSVCTYLSDCRSPESVIMAWWLRPTVFQSPENDSTTQFCLKSQVSKIQIMKLQPSQCLRRPCSHVLKNGHWGWWNKSVLKKKVIISDWRNKNILNKISYTYSGFLNPPIKRRLKWDFYNRSAVASKVCYFCFVLFNFLTWILPTLQK